MSKPTPHSTVIAGLIEALSCCQPLLKREAQRLKENLNRARKRDNPATLTFPEWLRIISLFKWRCALCRKGHFETMEHLLPICAGGGTTADNCVPCCRECNQLRNIVFSKEKNVRQKLTNLHI